MEITWSIAKLERNLPGGFVHTAHWTVIATDGDYSASSYGSCGFDGKLITPYEELTKEQVLGWVWEKVDKEETESNLAAQIETQKNPVTASGVPWLGKSS
jgi:hypothetical protein